MRTARLHAFVGSAGILTAAACSLVFPANGTQCSTTADCATRGGAFAGSVCIESVCVINVTGRDASSDARRDALADAATVDAPTVDAGLDAGHNPWSCLGHVRWPDASATPVVVTQPYNDLVTGDPVPGITVQPCSKLDTTCANPLADAAVTGEAGTVQFSLPSGYDGYLSSTWDAGLPVLAYVVPPAFVSSVELPVLMISNSTFEALAAAVTSSFDGGARMIEPTRGSLFANVTDCDGNFAAGVTFTTEPSSSTSYAAYIINGFPSFTATETDNSGNFGIVDVPPGSVTVTGTVVATGQKIGTTTSLVRASAISYTSIVPSP